LHGINNPTVISAMQKVKRHHFIDKNKHKNACGDYPLPIGKGHTISQTYKIKLPLGHKFQIQNLVLRVKKGDKIKKDDLIPVRFVSMTGKIKDN